jgi:hypothetical protein
MTYPQNNTSYLAYLPTYLLPIFLLTTYYLVYQLINDLAYQLPT